MENDSFDFSGKKKEEERSKRWDWAFRIAALLAIASFIFAGITAREADQALCTRLLSLERQAEKNSASQETLYKIRSLKEKAQCTKETEAVANPLKQIVKRLDEYVRQVKGWYDHVMDKDKNVAKAKAVLMKTNYTVDYHLDGCTQKGKHSLTCTGSLMVDDLYEKSKSVGEFDTIKVAQLFNEGGSPLIIYNSSCKISVGAMYICTGFLDEKEFRKLKELTTLAAITSDDMNGLGGLVKGTTGDQNFTNHDRDIKQMSAATVKVPPMSVNPVNCPFKNKKQFEKCMSAAGPTPPPPSSFQEIADNDDDCANTASCPSDSGFNRKILHIHCNKNGMCSEAK